MDDDEKFLTSGLISGEDTLAGSHDRLSDLPQLLLKLGGRVLEVGAHCGCGQTYLDQQWRNGNTFTQNSCFYVNIC